MDSSFSSRSMAMIALLVAILVVRAAAQDGAVGTQPAPVPTQRVLAGSDATKPTPTVAADTARDHSPGATALAPNGLKEVLKMVDAGISKDIIRMFIQNSTVACDLSADDIIALKQRGVPDEIAMALLKRSAELKAQASPISAGSPPAGPAAAAVSVTIPNYGGIDPESYAYFYHYYLHPRTLASVYQRLGVYGPAYPNGFYPPNGPFYSPQFGVPPGAAFQPYPRPWR
jgi:hypothetical protein